MRLISLGETASGLPNAFQRRKYSCPSLWTYVSSCQTHTNVDHSNATIFLNIDDILTADPQNGLCLTFCKGFCLITPLNISPHQTALRKGPPNRHRMSARSGDGNSRAHQKLGGRGRRVLILKRTRNLAESPGPPAGFLTTIN